MSDVNQYPLPYTDDHYPFDERESADVWPGDAKMAVLFYIAVEEWEWDQFEHMTVRGQFPEKNLEGTTKPSLSARSTVNYGFDIGLRRLGRILDERDQNITMWTTANAVAQHPEVVEDLRDAGHEIGGRTSYSEGTPVVTMTPEEQERQIDKSIEVYDDILGEVPEGWLGPAAVGSETTVDVLTRRDAKYHADLQDDELPYFIEKNGSRMVEIPYRMTGNINDFYLYAPRHMRFSTEQALDYLKSTFDAHYREASKQPVFFIYGTHPFVSGRPDSAYVFEQFLDYVHDFDDVWVPTYNEMADWWIEQFGDGY